MYFDRINPVIAASAQAHLLQCHHRHYVTGTATAIDTHPLQGLHFMVQGSMLEDNITPMLSIVQKSTWELYLQVTEEQSPFWSLTEVITALEQCSGSGFSRGGEKVERSG